MSDDTARPVGLLGSTDCVSDVSAHVGMQSVELIVFMTSELLLVCVVDLI